LAAVDGGLNMALTRKKITVRNKKGKTYQRSVMVKAATPVTRTRSTKSLTAGKALRKYGLGAFGIGAAHGIAMTGGALAGMHGAARTGKTDQQKINRGVLGGTAGMIAAQVGLVHGLNKSKRIARANQDISRNGTRGARLALAGLTSLGGLATTVAGIKAHNRAVNRGWLGGFGQ